MQLCVNLIFPQKKPGLCIVLYEGIPYFLVYKLTPIFQAKNNNIFESLTCISGPPMIDDTKQNRRNQGQETIIKEEVIGIFCFNISGGFFFLISLMY